MIRRTRLWIAPPLAALAVSLMGAAPFGRTGATYGPPVNNIQHDMSDLTPLPRTPNELYTGQNPSDLTTPASGDASAAAATSGSAPKRRKRRRRSQQGNAPTTGEAMLNSPSAGMVSTANAERPLGQKILDSIDLFYGFYLNGPSLNAPWGTTYSVWQQDTWPIYIYHTLDFQYHFDRVNLVGFEISAHQDLFSNITPTKWISPANPQLYGNDPQFWYTRKAVLDNRYFSTDVSFNVWPGITDPSVQSTQYFSASLDTTWNFKPADRRWTTYVATRLRPYLFGQYQPSDSFTHNEWFYASAGYYVGYNLTPSWQVNLSGVFDADLYADANQIWNRGDAADDRAQLELNYFAGRWARIGVYTQTVVTNPQLIDTVVGLDITVNMLSARIF
jgi:hypothetical protein